MIDAIISLKLILLLLFGILVLDDAFLTLQTAETINFFSSRAEVVQADSISVNQFFQDTILQKMIFTHENEFITIEPVQTDSNDQIIETKIFIHSPFAFFNSFFSNCQIQTKEARAAYCTHTRRIEMP